MLYLSKQEKNIEKNAENGDNRLPYFKLLEAEETTDENGEKKIDWKQAKELMVFWKSKSGKGYSGKYSEQKTEAPKVEKKEDDINFD